MKKALILAALGCAFSLSSCMNMPTPANQITGTYVSDLNYDQFDCRRLQVEKDALSRRESELSAAQTQRVKTSQVQAFWWGFGQGDSVEANELASVRGQQSALQKSIESKGCGITAAQ